MDDSSELFIEISPYTRKSPTDDRLVRARNLLLSEMVCL